MTKNFNDKDFEQTLAEQPAPVQQEPVAEAMARYLRVCSSGGMPKKLQESVQSLVNDAERLGYFKAAPQPAQSTAEKSELETVPAKGGLLPAQKQEPVAWMYQCSADSSGPVLTQQKKDWAESGSGLWTETALHTTPQPPAQRKPLTDEEIQECWYRTQGDAELFARAIEAAHGIKENT